jgi:aromatic ring-opening dioxygenase LigB subunit
MGAFVGSVLMCHAPIVVPEVGGSRGREALQTTTAMREAARTLVSRTPDVVVVVSPHTPRARRAFTVVDDESGFVHGDFSRFGVPDVGLRLPVARTLVSALKSAGADVEGITLENLDHGALVPLTFVVGEGYSGPVLVIGLPMVTTSEALHAFGRALRAAISESDARVAVVASGDMSHRLIPGAPSGHHPDGVRFDRALVTCIENGDLDAAIALPDVLRENAAEDVVESLAVVRGLIAVGEEDVRVLSYQGPYGVGYLVAVLALPREGDVTLRDAKKEST